MWENYKGPQPSTPVDFAWSLNTVEQDGELYVEGWASTNDVDLVNDRILPGAWESYKNEFKSMSILFNHDIDVVLGHIVDYKIDPDKGIFIKAHITTLDAEKRNLIKKGSLSKFSARFRSMNKYETSETHPITGQNIVVTNTPLAMPMEVSITSTPCNRRATLTGIIGGKMANVVDEVTKNVGKELQESLKSLGEKMKADAANVEPDKKVEENEVVKPDPVVPAFDSAAFKTEIMTEVSNTLAGFSKDMGTQISNAMGSFVEALKSETSKIKEATEESAKAVEEKLEEKTKDMDEKIKAFENESGGPQGKQVEETKDVNPKLSPGLMVLGEAVCHAHTGRFPQNPAPRLYLTNNVVITED